MNKAEIYLKAFKKGVEIGYGGKQVDDPPLQIRRDKGHACWEIFQEFEDGRRARPFTVSELVIAKFKGNPEDIFEDGGVKLGKALLKDERKHSPEKKMMILRAVGPYEKIDLDEVAEAVQAAVDKIYKPGEVTVLVLSGVATMEKKEFTRLLTETLMLVS